MVHFKLVRTNADYRKSKGAWVYSSSFDLLNECPQSPKTTVNPSRITLGFLNLPGEVRNQIYSYYFEPHYETRVELMPGRRQLSRPNPGLELQQRAYWARDRKCWPQMSEKVEKKRTVFQQPRLHGSYNRKEGEKTKWATSLCALILTCRQVYMESVGFLYSNPEFAICGSLRLNRFFEIVPDLVLRLLTNLSIEHTTYGYPESPKMNIWKKRADASWKNAIYAVAAKATGLKLIRIRLHVVESPLIFKLTEDWVQALLPLRSLCAPPREKRMEIKKRRIKAEKKAARKAAKEVARRATEKATRGNAKSALEEEEDIEKQKAATDEVIEPIKVVGYPEFPGLTDLKITLSTRCLRQGHWACDDMTQHSYALHRLFEIAIERYIKGETREAARADFEAAYRSGKWSKYAMRFNLLPPW